jgi:hypothetical protein
MIGIFGLTASRTTSRIFIRLLLLGIGRILAAQTTIASNDFCSLVVQVTDPQGTPMRAKVTVVDSSLRRLPRKTGADGKVSFCDLGLRPVDVVVGEGGCGELVVKSVDLAWGRSKLLPVVYAPCWLDGEPPPTTACEILLRFSDERGEPIRGVSVKTQFGSHDSLSDRYGRIRIGIGFDKTLEVTAVAPGFRSERLGVACSQADRIIERDVRMNRQSEK